MTETRWLDEREQRAWRSFLTASRLLLDTLDRELQQDAGMPHTYYEILVRLSEAPDQRLRMSELADAMRGSRSRLSHAVARLAEAGWVRRIECPSDRRGQFAVLTPGGRRVLSAAGAGHVQNVRSHLFDALTPAQVDQLTEISEAVLKRLEKQ